MHTKTIEKKNMHMFTVLCHNEAQERHLLRLLDNVYLDLMRDPESSVHQGDGFKASVESLFGPVCNTKNDDEPSDVDGGHGQSSSESEG